MSYALTDAGEADMKAEVKVLDRLVDDIDQMHSEALACDTIAPLVAKALEIASWYAEEAYREVHGSGSCGHARTEKGCGVCAYFFDASRRNRAGALRGRL